MFLFTSTYIHALGSERVKPCCSVLTNCSHSEGLRRHELLQVRGVGGSNRSNGGVGLATPAALGQLPPLAPVLKKPVLLPPVLEPLLHLVSDYTRTVGVSFTYVRTRDFLPLVTSFVYSAKYTQYQDLN